MFEIGEYDPEREIIHFSKGGFQGGRGASNGEEFYIENVIEELDYPKEYFFNKTTRTLYYYNNQTNNTDPSDLLFEATNLKILFNFTKTSDHEIRGITFKDTSYTYLDDHSMPSGLLCSIINSRCTNNYFYRW